MGWTFRPESVYKTPVSAPASQVSASRARRAFYLALARSRSDMLSVAEEVWERAVTQGAQASTHPDAVAPTGDGLLAVFSKLAQGECDRDRISKEEMEQVSEKAWPWSCGVFFARMCVVGWRPPRPRACPRDDLCGFDPPCVWKSDIARLTARRSI